MPIAIGDPYGGGTPDVGMGQSTLNPRETYSADRRAINEQYSDNEQKTQQLVSSLSQFQGAVGNIEDAQRKKDLAGAEVAATQVMGSIKSGENVDLKVGNLLPGKSPLFHAAVSEAVGRQLGQRDAQDIYQNMPPEIRNDPEASRLYFDGKAKEAANANVGSPFFNNAYVSGMQRVFGNAYAATSAQRNEEQQKLMEQDGKQQTDDVANGVYRDWQENPADYSGGIRGQQLLNGALGSQIKAAARAHGIAPEVLAMLVDAESSGRTNIVTGSYKGLGQLSDAEFQDRKPGGNIFNAADNLDATAGILADRIKEFTAKTGHAPATTEVYLMHNQGLAGLVQHEKNPDAPAWQNFKTASKDSDLISKLAIWGNIPNDQKAKLGLTPSSNKISKDNPEFLHDVATGAIEKPTSRQFISMWDAKLHGQGGAFNPSSPTLVSAKSKGDIPGGYSDTFDNSGGAIDKTMDAHQPLIDKDMAGQVRSFGPDIPGGFSDTSDNTRSASTTPGAPQQTANTKVADNTDPNTATDAVKIAAFSPSLDNLHQQAAPQDNGKKTYDYAGRVEFLPPEVQALRDKFMANDEMQNYTHPTLNNAQKRTNMVDSTITLATNSGNPAWLKAVPNQILTPVERDKLVKAEKQIIADNSAKLTAAFKLKEQQRKEDSLGIMQEANDFITQHPTDPFPPELLQRADNVDPTLRDNLNSQRKAVIGNSIDSVWEDRQIVKLEDQAMQIAAAGGDPRNVNYQYILDPAKRTALMNFTKELIKSGGETSNPYYKSAWESAANSHFGFVYGVNQKTTSDPHWPEIEHEFQKQLAHSVAAYVPQNGTPLYNRQRADIFKTALDATEKIYPPTNFDPKQSGHSLPKPADKDQQTIEKYKLGQP
jgi:hypothetical protein